MEALPGIDNEKETQQRAVNAVKLFKKKKASSRNLKKRSLQDLQDIDNDEESAVLKKQKTKHSINSHTVRIFSQAYILNSI